LPVRTKEHCNTPNVLNIQRCCGVRNRTSRGERLFIRT